eukprot:PhF_6_TR13319/c0_g1_i2/m.21108
MMASHHHHDQRRAYHKLFVFDILRAITSFIPMDDAMNLSNVCHQSWSAFNDAPSDLWRDLGVRDFGREWFSPLVMPMVAVRPKLSYRVYSTFEIRNLNISNFLFNENVSESMYRRRVFFLCRLHGAPENWWPELWRSAYPDLYSEYFHDVYDVILPLLHILLTLKEAGYDIFEAMRKVHIPYSTLDVFLDEIAGGFRHVHFHVYTCAVYITSKIIQPSGLQRQWWWKCCPAAIESDLYEHLVDYDRCSHCYRKGEERLLRWIEKAKQINFRRTAEEWEELCVC